MLLYLQKSSWSIIDLDNFFSPISLLIYSFRIANYHSSSYTLCYHYFEPGECPNTATLSPNYSLQLVLLDPEQILIESKVDDEKCVLSRPVATDVKRTPWMARANAKGKHIVRKPPSSASAAGRHLPNWKTVHHLEKANQAAQLWRDDTLEAAGADGGEQPFINRGEMREDSHLAARIQYDDALLPRAGPSRLERPGPR